MTRSIESDFESSFMMLFGFGRYAVYPTENWLNSLPVRIPLIADSDSMLMADTITH